MFGIDETILIRGIGLTFVGLWLAARFGLWKRWYWRSPRSVYPYLPFGLLFLVYPEYERVRAAGGETTLYVAILIALGAVAIWWIMSPPDWIKPEWVRWVDKHPKRTYQAMREAISDGAAWREHISDERAVDRWAKRVKRKGK